MLDALTSRAPAARGQGQDKHWGSPVPRGRDPHRAPVSCPPVLPWRTGLSVGVQRRRRGAGDVLDDTDLGEYAHGKGLHGDVKGDTAPCGEKKVSVVLAGPSLWHGSILYSHLFLKVCKAQERATLSEPRRPGGSLTPQVRHGAL